MLLSSCEFTCTCCRLQAVFANLGKVVENCVFSTQHCSCGHGRILPNNHQLSPEHTRRFPNSLPLDNNLTKHPDAWIHLNIRSSCDLSVSVRKFPVTVTTNCRAITSWMNVNYEVCHEWTSSLMFQFIWLLLVFWCRYVRCSILYTGDGLYWLSVRIIRVLCLFSSNNNNVSVVWAEDRINIK
jgi:hypothetical protein